MAKELDSKIKAIKLSPDYLSLRDKSVAQFSKLSLHVSNIIQCTQLFRYGMMVEIANEIQEKIKSNDAREALYLKLVRVLALTSETYDSTIFQVAMQGYLATRKEMDSQRSNKELTAALKNLVNRWLYGTEEDQRKLKNEIRLKTGLDFT